MNLPISTEAKEAAERLHSNCCYNEVFRGDVEQIVQLTINAAVAKALRECVEKLSKRINRYHPDSKLWAPQRREAIECREAIESLIPQ